MTATSTRTKELMPTQEAATLRLASRSRLALVSLLLVVFALCVFIRAPSLMIYPRFWAEEGKIYYQYLEHVPFWQGLFYIGNGNYQLLTNLFSMISVHIADRYAAWPTTYLGFLVDLYAAFLIAEFMLNRAMPIASIAASLVLFAVQPAGYEVFLTTTNVMWICGICSLLICLSPERRVISPRALIDYLSVALFGLTGVTSCVLFPFFAARALIYRSTYSAMLFGLIASTTLIQAAIVITHGATPERAMTLTAHGLIPLVFQTVLTNFVPAELLDIVGARIQAYDFYGWGMAIQIISLSGVIALLITSIAVGRLNIIDLSIIICAWLFVPLVNEFGSIGGVSGMHSGWSGGRYFILGNTCFLLLTGLATSSRLQFQRFVAIGSIALMLSNALIQSLGSGWIDIFTKGPSVMEQVDACDGRRPCWINVLPMTSHLAFRMDRTQDASYKLPPPGVN